MLFNKKKCENCSSPLGKDWEFCPRCGEPLGSANPFEEVFEDMESKFGNMEKLFSFPEIKFTKGHDSGGVSISIVSGTGMEPKISVQTSGRFRDLEPEIMRQLGAAAPEKRKQTKQRRVKFEKTEEPKMEMKKGKNELTYSIRLPGISSLRSIDIKRLESSIEIRAAAGNKLYFKLFEVPEGFELAEKSFKNELLSLALKRQ